jgi:hypothetical protein
MKHLAALGEEIEAFEKIATNNESAAKYLETQVKKIADYIATLTNVPTEEMEAMKKMLAETAAQLKSNEEEAKAHFGKKYGEPGVKRPGFRSFRAGL